MATAVKSMRIKRGGYSADLNGSNTILITSDQRLRDMQEEIDRLQKGLLRAVETAENNAIIETNRKVEAAFKNGYKEGIKQGVKEGRASIAEAVELISKLMVEIESGFDSVWKNCRSDMVELIIIIVSKIVGVVADQYENLAMDLTKRCTIMVRDQARLKILINPCDAETLRNAEVELKSLAEGVKEIEFAERASIRQGGVVIETENGQIDARIDEQLASVEAALKPGWNDVDKDS